MPSSKTTLRLALATAVLLLIPFMARQFTSEVTWTLLDFVIAGILLLGAGFAYAVVAQKGLNLTYRVAVGVAVAAGLLLVWANMAVGLIGSEHNPVNLLYSGVLVVAVMGAVAARFRPLGMSRAMFAAALMYVAVTGIALFIWPPSAATAKPSVHLANVLGANMVFAALWAVAGWLFRRASRPAHA